MMCRILAISKIKIFDTDEIQNLLIYIDILKICRSENISKENWNINRHPKTFTTFQIHNGEIQSNPFSLTIDKRITYTNGKSGFLSTWIHIFGLCMYF